MFPLRTSPIVYALVAAIPFIFSPRAEAASKKPAAIPKRAIASARPRKKAPRKPAPLAIAPKKPAGSAARPLAKARLSGGARKSAAGSKAKGARAPAAQARKGRRPGKETASPTNQNSSRQSGKGGAQGTGGQGTAGSGQSQPGVGQRKPANLTGQWHTISDILINSFEGQDPTVDIQDRPDRKESKIRLKFPGGATVTNTSKDDTSTVIVKTPGGPIDVVKSRGGEVEEWLQINPDDSEIYRHKDGTVVKTDPQGKILPSGEPPIEPIHPPPANVIDLDNPGYYTNGNPIPGMGKSPRPAPFQPGTPLPGLRPEADGTSFPDRSNRGNKGGKRGDKKGPKQPEGSIGGEREHRELLDGKEDQFGNGFNQGTGDNGSSSGNSGSDSDQGSDSNSTDSTFPDDSFPDDSSPDYGTGSWDDDGSDDGGSDGTDSDSGGSGDDADDGGSGGGGSDGSGEGGAGGGEGGGSDSGSGGSGGQSPPKFDFGETDWYTDSEGDSDEGWTPAEPPEDFYDDDGSDDGSDDGASDDDSDDGSDDDAGSDDDDSSSGNAGENAANDSKSNVGYTPSDPDQPVVNRDPATTAALRAGFQNILRSRLGNQTTPTDDDTGDGGEGEYLFGQGDSTTPLWKGKSLIVNPSEDSRALPSAASLSGLNVGPSPNEILPAPDAPDAPTSGSSEPPIQNEADNVGGDSGTPQPGSEGQTPSRPSTSNGASSSNSSHVPILSIIRKKLESRKRSRVPKSIADRFVFPSG